ncbi:MAG TPA: SIS domain-containing protein [Pseudonocardiaceae bacterium]|nr:SIS domain-containing protein [Pseudonocardiaceae bacterium]
MNPGTNGHGSMRPQVPTPDQSRSDDLASLYPFLYAHPENVGHDRPGAGDLEAVLAEVRRSTVDKVHQIVALRREVLAQQGQRLAACASAMAASFAQGGRLFAIGNGGSCTDAADLASLFLHPGPGKRAVPAFALTGDIAVLTALSNDVSFDVVFARQIAAFGRRGDVVVGLSTSGNSTNLVRAFEEAGRRGLLTVGLAGYEGGAMAELGSIDHLFVVPSDSVHRIQEAQTTVYHTLWELTLNELTTGRRDPAQVERREVARGVGDHV